MGATEYGGGVRAAIVREYGATDDPFTSIDHQIGKAKYTPGLATVGETITDLSPMVQIVRDNVVACTDFRYGQEVGRMSCVVFKKANFNLAPMGDWKRKLKPAAEPEGVGVDVSLSASPRMVTIPAGSPIAPVTRVYVLYRPAGNNHDVFYVAFEDIDAEAITYDAMAAGLAFPASFDGPQRLFSHVRINTEIDLQPTKTASMIVWPLFPADFFVSQYGSLGHVGGSGNFIPVFARGLSM